jgi:hypothetical protein
MKRVTEATPIALEELRHMATGRFGDMVKAVVDLRRAVMLLDADMHADQEAGLLTEGSAHGTSGASISTRISTSRTGWISIP